jgi:hypothetical protein
MSKPTMRNVFREAVESFSLMHIRMSTYYAALLFVPLSAAGQQWNVGCLPIEQQQKFLAQSQQLVADMRLQEDIARLQELAVRRQKLFPEANECRSHGQNPLELFQALSYQCVSAVQEYKKVASQQDALEEQVSSNQRLIFTQMTLNRSLLASCP